MSAASLVTSVASQAGTTLLGVVLAVGGFIGILAIVFFIAGRVTGRFERPLAIIICLVPALFLVTLGLIIPALTTINNSFTDQQFLGQQKVSYIGLKNYIHAFTDPATQQTIVRTVLWLLIVPAFAVGVGMLMALLVDRMKHPSLPKTMVFLPTAISFVGAAVIWGYVYSWKDPSLPQTGLLSQLAIWLGWNNPPNWMLSSPLNTFLMMVILIWIQAGFSMVVLGAALKAIPEEVVESARMDGASGWRLFRSIQVPMIRSTIVVVLTTVMITTLKVFDIVFTMTNGNFNTDIIARRMFSDMFVTSQVGRGSALAVILFIAVIPLVFYNVRQLRREREIR